METSYNINDSGVSLDVQSLVEALAGAGHTVVVVTPNAPAPEEEETSDEMDELMAMWMELFFPTGGGTASGGGGGGPMESHLFGAADGGPFTI